jgi:uncharacterized protein YmfQ (DUF2313 family)
MKAPYFSASDYLGAMQSLMPVGKVWPKEVDSVQAKVLQGLAASFTRSNANANNLLIDTFPSTTSGMLPEWEATLGLPDTCCTTDSAITIDQRRVRVAEKYASVGGQSRQYFINLAAHLGYTDVSISEFSPMTCESPCDRAVYGEDWRFVWQMNVGDYIAIHNMTCEDPCDSPLRSWQANELQCRVNQLKPAHTQVLMNRTMTQEQIDVAVAFGREDIQAAAPVLHALLNTTLPSANYW